MEENDSVSGKLWQPRFKIVLYVLITVRAIYMEKVDRPIGKLESRFLEGHRHQMRKPRVPAIVGRYFVPNLRTVDSGVHVPTPGIDSVTPRDRAVFLNRLAESEIGFSFVNPQFNQDLGL